eukprot:CAMPEP_0172448504 /NCGR_PEP_ID=MMETSP1065-20121228/7520_1 /TAXON_ID=265537 /ORGANISM="Amphiprora paludosa, Strain CCMP125" /LENGTH=191 /DNA_ID=CAMNT_0013200033 /DNA_START=656 /DNA_END=1231 /DNA_ORIENTATION=-
MKATKAGKATVAKKGKSTITKKPKSDLSSEIRILIAIVQENRAGVAEPCRKRVASSAEMNNFASFTTICGRMKKKNLVTYPGSKTIVVTELGMDEVKSFLPPEPTCNKDRFEELKAKISRSKVRELFDALTDGSDHLVSDLAKCIGYEETNPSFRTYLGGLNPNVEKFKASDGAKMIRLKDECFPFGRGAE